MNFRSKPMILAQTKSSIKEEDDAPSEEAAAQVEVENTAEAPAEEAPAEAPAEEAPAEEAPAAEEAQVEPEAPVEEEKPKPKPAPKKKVAAKKAAPAPKKAATKKKKAAPKAPEPVVEEAPAEEAAPAEEQVQQEAAVEEGSAEGAEAEAQAQAEAEAQAQAEAEAQAAPVAKGKKAPVSATADVNQAAAVAAAAAELIPEDKPWAKMSAAEKTKKKAKDAAEKKAKKEKEERENPTVDENGEHIQTVAEAKVEAKQLQEMLDAGTAAVEEKIKLDQERLANEPVNTEPVKQEEDDGHVETVAEVKARMEALTQNMNQGLAQTDERVAKMQEDSQNMPDFGALADLHGSIANMGKNRKKKQMADMAEKLGVELQAGDEDKDPNDLTGELMERAKAAGKSEDQIQAALAE